MFLSREPKTDRQDVRDASTSPKKKWAGFLAFALQTWNAKLGKAGRRTVHLATPDTRLAFRVVVADLPEDVQEQLFPSPTNTTGHVQDPHFLYTRIKASTAKF